MQDHKANGRIQNIQRRWRFFFVSILSICIVSACAPAWALAAGETSAKAHYATADFATHMPVLVMEATGETLEGNDFFFEGTVSTYDESANNSPHAMPTATEAAVMRNMTDKTNRSSEKCDFYLRFGERADLLGLGEAEEYILLGAKDDKSLIRNYLGYQIAAGIMQDAPGYRLCEVFDRTAQGDMYQGVYLLVQKETNDSAALFYHGIAENGIAIDTYSTLNNTTAGHMYIPMMESTQWDDRYGDIIGKISTAESVLYSSNSAVFYTYMDLFDVTSFVNRFILGELMEDYAGVLDGYYYYDTDTELFSAAPIWDFALALDNQAAVHADVDEIQYDEATYYEQFFKSHQFATQVQSRYLALRRSVLDEITLMRYIDEAAAYVAPAVQRDWDRWDAYSHHVLMPLIETEEGGDTLQESTAFSRQAQTFDEEILRLKYQLREHSLKMAFNLTGFDFSEREISKEIVLNTNPVWFVIFLVVFFSLIRFARRYGV